MNEKERELGLLKATHKQTKTHHRRGDQNVSQISSYHVFLIIIIIIIIIIVSLPL